MRLKSAVAAVATAGLGFVLPAHAQESEAPQMTFASELTTDGFRVAEATDGFRLVEHGIWRMPPAGSSEPPAADAGRTYLNRPGIAGGPNSRVEGSTMSKTTNKFSPEVRERSVRPVLDQEGEHPSR